MTPKRKPTRIFHDLVAQIEGAIVDGKLQPGEKLPAERDLRETFAISRGSLREALRVLEQKGLIDIRLGPNGGAVVKPADTGCMTETLALLVKRRKVSLNDLAEFREGVEGHVAALAARRAGRTDIMMLKGILNETRQLLTGGIANWEAFIQADEKFHKALAQIADNPVYRFVLEVVQDNISSYYESFPLRSMDMMTENFEDLKELVTQIELGRAQGAKALFQRHIRKFNRYMKIEGSDGAHQTADAN